MNAILARAQQVWERVFFAPEWALNLAAARVLFSVHALWVLLSRDLPATSSLPPEFWTYVLQGERWRFLIFPGHPQLEYSLQYVAILTLIGAAVGFMPRLCCFVSALLLYHLAPLETIYWTASPYQRGFTIDVLALFTLSLAPCGDALRIGKISPKALSSAYCWSLRLTQVYLVHTYFFSGYAKLYRVGVSWMSPENLRSWFLLFSQQDQVMRVGPVFNTVGPWIADHWWLCAIAGVYGVVVNLLFVSTLFSSRARWFFIPDAVFFHILVFLTLNIFWLNLPQLLVFVNWQWLVDRLHKNVPAVDARPDVRP
jgi:hypothetical protein